MTARRGQVALYLVGVLVAITILMLADVGAFLAVRAKNRAMNAGDAAALAAAKRQGELLNEIGRLNLRHAEVEFGELAKPPKERDWNAARKIILEIIENQRRLCFLGPLDCLREANAAAKKNGAGVSKEMSDALRRHASDVLTKYTKNPDQYPEPWDGAWEEYAAEISSIAANGVAAGLDNANFLDAIECFPLTSKSFYSMIEGQSWCKIAVAGWTWLLDMDLRHLPQPTYTVAEAVVNCEFCSLNLRTGFLVLDVYEKYPFLDLLNRCGAELTSISGDHEEEDDRPADDQTRLYFFYDRSAWCEWSPIIAKMNLPLMGTIKPEFDVRGCSVVFRVIENIPQLISETSRSSVWNAAAKPFGTIKTSSSDAAIVTDDEAKGMVLPAFEAVRLVPLCLADPGDMSTADDKWLDHVREHVPKLFTDGNGGLDISCNYCWQLRKWDDPEFRSNAMKWISKNAETCRRGTKGSGPAGGTSYAH